MEEFRNKEETYRIIGTCFEVYNEKGCGFLEPVYQDCLEYELGLQEIPFQSQPSLQLSYKGHPLKHTYEPDFICFGNVVVEIKAVQKICDEHRAQLINYLNVTGLKVGLLVNFGHYPKLEYERIVNTKKEATDVSQPADHADRTWERLKKSTLICVICGQSQSSKANAKRLICGQ